jgi:tRNA(Ile)-lysidine synthase
MDRIADACRRVFEEFAAFSDQKKIFVGYSGGLDSSVLLHALSHSAGESSQRVVAVHVDHGLDGLSVEWRRHCEQAAGEFGVEIITRSLALETGANLEARARQSRYQIYAQLLEQGGVLLLAHHLDDQSESVLQHLLQGRGLFGIPQRRQLGEGLLVRPLLELPRSELESYAARHRLSWVEDGSNRDLTIDRNYLRHRILPDLKARYDNLAGRLSRVLGRVQSTELALLESLGLERRALPLATLSALSVNAAVAVVRLWLREQNPTAQVTDRALADYVRQLQAPADRQPSLETSSGQLRRYRNDLHFVANTPPLATEYPLSVPGVLALPHGELVVSEPCVEAVGRDPTVSIRGALRVVFADRQSQTRLQLGGRGRRPRALLRDAGVPPWERDRYPLLFDDDGLLALPNIALRDGAVAETGCGHRLEWRPVGVVDGH